MAVKSCHDVLIEENSGKKLLDRGSPHVSHATDYCHVAYSFPSSPLVLEHRTYSLQLSSFRDRAMEREVWLKVAKAMDGCGLQLSDGNDDNLAVPVLGRSC